MADVKLVKSIYTGGDVTSLGELAAADNAKIPGSLEVTGAAVALSINDLTPAAQAVGFTIAGGTTSKTLTVDETVALSAKALSVNTLKGDGTAGRVLRCMSLKLENGTTAVTVKATTASIWSGDANGPTDNIPANDTLVGNFMVSGGTIKVVDAGISGTIIATLTAVISYNFSGTALTINASISSNNLQLDFYNAATGADAVLTTLVDTGIILSRVFYVTSA